MHPALSVIIFTTVSGIGYGLLALLGVLAGAGILPTEAGFGITAGAAALILISAGLLSSTFHLGHPERAWRALSQWRTSWLSREGIMAVATFVPAVLFGLTWALLDRDSILIALLGWATGLMALATVYCTAMIYASLRTVHQWHNRWVVPNYLALSIFTGMLWLHAFLHLWSVPHRRHALAILALGLVTIWIKGHYWRFVGTTDSASTPESATGLGSLGQVRLLEAPHTEENYLMKEMGFRIARKHASRLRMIALALMFAIPLLLTLVAAMSAGWVGALSAVLAALVASAGTFVERWLFFAEAKHTVTLYYGAAKA